MKVLMLVLCVTSMEILFKFNTEDYFYLFLLLQELVALKPCKAAELAATHFSEQIETVIKKLQVNSAEHLVERQLLSTHLRNVYCDGFFRSLLPFSSSFYIWCVCMCMLRSNSVII